MAVNVLAFAGSLRSESFNKKLVRIAAHAAERAGAEVTLLDLRDLNLPLYDGDLEDSLGLPEGARRLKQLMIASDAFLISSPEYNSSISGALKNAIDWASRPAPGEPPLAPFRGKLAGLMAASPGGFGGIRALPTVRLIFSNLGTLVLPTQVALPRANEAFHQDGSLKDPKIQRAVEQLAQEVVEMGGALKEQRAAA
jgi:chromate reductase